MDNRSKIKMGSKKDKKYNLLSAKVIKRAFMDLFKMSHIHVFSFTTPGSSGLIGPIGVIMLPVVGILLIFRHPEGAEVLGGVSGVIVILVALYGWRHRLKRSRDNILEEEEK